MTDRVASGDDGLDEILNGGLPVRGLLLGFEQLLDVGGRVA